MSLVSSPLLVLHSFRYAEDKLIAECLSPHQGMVTLLVRISHSARATVRHTLFRPMAFLDVEWEERPRQRMHRPKSARLSVQLLDLQAHPHKMAMVLFLSEFLLYVFRSEAASQDLFLYLRRAMEWLDAAPCDFVNFHIVFLLRLSLFLGISPRVDDAALPYFDLLAGEYVADCPAHAHFVLGKEAQDLSALMRVNFGTMRVLRLSRHDRQRILELTLTYYRLHLPAMPELRSLEVLRELYED